MTAPNPHPSVDALFTDGWRDSMDGKRLPPADKALCARYMSGHKAADARRARPLWYGVRIGPVKSDSPTA